MILLGTTILIFPHLLASIVAACFILSGLLLTQSLRNLRKAAARIRDHLEVKEEQVWETSRADLVPRRMYTSYIN